MIIAYIVVAFVVFFVVFKKHSEREANKARGSYAYYADPLDSAMLAFVVAAPWIISIPVIVAWRAMEKIYDKFNNPKTKN